MQYKNLEQEVKILKLILEDLNKIFKSFQKSLFKLNLHLV